MHHPSSGRCVLSRCLAVTAMMAVAPSCSDEDKSAGIDSGTMLGGVDAGAVGGGVVGGGSGGADAAGGVGGTAGTGGLGVGGFAGTATSTPSACDDGSCLGVCEGQGCGTAWTCVMDERACTDDLALFCGCDGFNFRGSGSCPSRSFAHKGSCATFQCDQRKVRCRAAPPQCPGAHVPSVIDGCWGPCVALQFCACGEEVQCPPGSFRCSEDGQCVRLLI